MQVAAAVLALCGVVSHRSALAVEPDGQTATANLAIMSIDDVRPGMEGVGKTVLQGTQITTFNVKVLGVVRDIAPGRDLVLSKLSGAGLENSGVIAGMSGSPVYIADKLLGAVAYAWPFGKEPIAGITPFEQMRSFAAQPATCTVTLETTADGTVSVEALDLAGDPYVGLGSAAGEVPASAKSGAMAPIALPLSAAGFGQQSLAELKRHLEPLGVIPVACGGASDDVKAAEPTHPIAPGAALAAGLVTGDFDLSGFGTVTHVEGNRVWGWGHPFMAGGRCEYLLRSGHVHLVNPKYDLSTKIGSPLSIRGVINVDVSTCIAGELGAKPDLLPMLVTLQQGRDGAKEEYRVEIVRHATLVGPLVATVLSNVFEGSGSLDQEITIDLNATISAQGLEPIHVQNTYSGGSVAGSKGVMGLLNQVAIIADGLTRNPFCAARIESIECHTVVTPRRTSAGILAARLNSDEFAAGDALRATATLRPYKCDPVEVELRLALPASMEPGKYTATVCDATVHLKSLFNEEPNLLAARSVDEIARAYRLQLEEKRHALYLRVVTRDGGVSVGEVNLPQLPASVQAAFSSRRASPARTLRRSLVARQPTQWVIEGSTNLPFTIVESKRSSG